MFGMIAQQSETEQNIHSYYVYIEIPKPQRAERALESRMSVNPHQNQQVASLEHNLKIKVIPALRELYGRDELMDYLFNLEPGDLVKDTIDFLGYVQQKSNSDVRNAKNVLISYPNPKVVKELLLKLHEASRVDSQIFSRLNKEVKDMKKYHVKMEQDVKQLQVEYERILREQHLAAQVHG